jgi:hypothetical protein
VITMPSSRHIPIKIDKAFKEISTQIDPHVDPNLGKYMIDLIKDKEQFTEFKLDPSAALKKHGLDERIVNIDLLKKVVQSISDRITDQIGQGHVMENNIQRESSSYQDRNFDHSSSWFANRDGYNVIYDAGHSSQQSRSEMIGQERNFGGISIDQSIQVIHHEINQLFFPAQPLVTPELIGKIKTLALK